MTVAMAAVRRALREACGEDDVSIRLLRRSFGGGLSSDGVAAVATKIYGVDSASRSALCAFASASQKCSGIARASAHPG